MKLNYIILGILVFIPQIIFAQVSILSCAVNSEGKAIVLDSAKPGKTFSVAKVKSKLVNKKEKLINQQADIRNNDSLTKAKKNAKLAVIKTKIADVKASINLVKSCKNNSTPNPTPTPGNDDRRTQILVDGANCYASFNDCNFHGQLLPQSLYSQCSLGRTLVLTHNGNPVGQVVTSSDPAFFSGNWNIDVAPFPGAGTYVITLQESSNSTGVCLGAHATYSIDANANETFVENVY